MSFSGSLEHLPIIDIIQLLNSTRKSGTLKLLGSKGEIRLVFSDGHIVCADHNNNSIRLGKVLLSMNAITPEILKKTLDSQKEAGAAHQPLIAMLIDSGSIDKDLAFKGLEALIVMTIIDVLTWDGGSFTVDVDDISLSEDYQYVPERFHKDFSPNTQNILMDALRIYDEKRHDGELSHDGIFSARDDEEWFFELPASVTEVAAEDPEIVISADILGLDEFDHLEKKIPDVFKGLHLPLPKQVATDELDLGEITAEERANLLVAIEKLTTSAGERSLRERHLLILYSRDRLLKGTISALCKRNHWSFFTIDEVEGLDLLIENALTKEMTPFLILDSPCEETSQEHLLSIASGRITSYPDLVVVQLYAPDESSFALHMLQNGARLVLPKIVLPAGGEIIENLLLLLRSLFRWLSQPLPAPRNRIDNLFIETLISLESLNEPADISATLLKFVASIFVRGQTFVVVKENLVAERGFDRDRRVEGIGPFPLKSKIAIDEIATFQRVVESGESFWGVPADFQAIAEATTTPPHLENILLLPIVVDNRTVAVVYGDYGLGEAVESESEKLSILARTAGLVLEKVLRLKRAGG